MERLNFKIPEFVRVAWATKQAERVWGPLLPKLSNFCQELERLGVQEGIRKVIIQNVKPEQLLAHRFRKLFCLPIASINIGNSYQSATPQFDKNLPWEYRCAIGDPQTASELLVAHDAGFDDLVGQLLGYPKCCRDFFMQVWVKEQWFDTTYMMSYTQDQDAILHPGNNLLLRWLGIRLVSHLPCSHHCSETTKIAEANISLAKNTDHSQEIDQIIEMLSWPIEWSSLHGIAIITTPVFKIITATDALAQKATVRLKGTRYPAYAGSGLTFPFKQCVTEKDTWTDNGFPNLKSMSDAHENLIAKIIPLQPKSVIDFGCGNGLLLRKLRTMLNARTFGIDSVADKNPDHVGDIYNWNFPHDEIFDLALISRNRIVEDAAGWGKLVNRIKSNCKQLIIYDYTTGEVTIQELNR